MPSLSHRVVTLALGHGRSSTVTDVEAVRGSLAERNRGRRTRPPERLLKRYDVAVRDLGFPAYVLTPRGATPDRTLLYLHGGSFTAKAHPAQWRYADRVARGIGARLVVPAYPLAPEHTWRDSHDAVVGLARDLLAEGPLVVSGDSAGGGLALAVTEALRDQGGEQPTHLVLLAPWVDLTNSAPGTHEAGRRDPWLNHENLDVYARFWAGGADDLARWEVSPGLGNLDGLPRALMLCGTHDVLFPGCEELARRAGEADWDLDFVVGHGLLHVYPILPVSEARPARRRIVEFLRT